VLAHDVALGVGSRGKPPSHNSLRSSDDKENVLASLQRLDASAGARRRAESMRKALGPSKAD
jgi:hypothetical protein